MANTRMYPRIRGKITEVYGSIGEFSKHLGLSVTSVSSKLNGHTTFTIPEVEKWAKLLSIPHDDIVKYFFTH